MAFSRTMGIWLCAGVVACATSRAVADEDQAATIARLEAHIARLEARLEALEGVRTERLDAPGPKTARASTSSWTERVAVKGDFRYRHEAFDIERREERHRQRIRARINLTGQVSDALEVGFGLASGGDDPVSTNQTLGDGFSSKGVVIDLAYAKWTAPIKGLDVSLGKFRNPLHRAGGHGLVWDGDLRPEGVAVRYSAGNWFARGLGGWVNESSGSADTLLIGTQVGSRMPLGKGELLGAVGYYHYTNAQGRRPFFDGDPRGNRVDAAGNLLSDFHLVEGLAEYSLEVGEFDVSVYVDYVNNTGADRFETAYAVGAGAKRGKWAFGWAYQDIEPDAVFALFSDSDFIGGGSDGKGHILASSYALGQRTKLSATVFLNERNLDFGRNEDFRRLQLDVQFKF